MTDKPEYKSLPKISVASHKGAEYVEQYDINSKYDRRDIDGHQELDQLSFSQMAKMYEAYWGKKKDIINDDEEANTVNNIENVENFDDTENVVGDCHESCNVENCDKSCSGDSFYRRLATNNNKNPNEVSYRRLANNNNNIPDEESLQDIAKNDVNEECFIWPYASKQICQTILFSSFRYIG